MLKPITDNYSVFTRGAIKQVVILLLFLFFANCLLAQQEIKSGAYLGMPHPGMTPEIFAPGIISGKGRLHTSPAFSNDNKEIYWMVLPPQIMTMNDSSQGWTNPIKAAFSTGPNNQAPFVAHDGKIYFASYRSNGNGSLDIWFVNKSDTGYSLPINIGEKVNSSKSESMPSVSGMNTLFFSGNLEGKLYNRGIYYSRFENGEYQKPVALPEQINIINKNNLDYTPFIAPDESYLLFSSNRQNPEQELCHLYISYKDKNGEWSKPIDLSLKMNFLESSKFPYISPDNKFLFFSSGNNIYWVSADIIKEDALQETAIQKFTKLKGDYLGQTPPGNIPEVFARGIVSSEHLEHSAPRFSPDGTEVFWEIVRLPIVEGVSGKMIMTMHHTINGWSQPTEADSFPVFTSDGKLFYFSALPKPNKDDSKTENQEDSGNQANHIHLLARFPELKYTRGLSIADNRNIYFMAHLEGPFNGIGIYRAELINGEYAKPEPLPLKINKEGFLNWTPFIAPDESYLLFSSNRHDPENDAGDLYISYRSGDGLWSEPLNIGAPVNTINQERFPMLSQDGKYLFFTRPTSEFHQDVFWVNAKIINELKKEVFKQ